jgi:hypothetical protein
MRAAMYLAENLKEKRLVKKFREIGSCQKDKTFYSYSVLMKSSSKPENWLLRYLPIETVEIKKMVCNAAMS